ncbi:hypothetical protein FCL40_11075 [Ferrimonas sediminicola]|uniref:Uncharacterized protein n=1 Tax=Ferrimonas sediminicola TaxID=2569538 RepID=A0A4U1BD65_9GAMM|nr:hypothetical protein [Ferrimonas sediminicola]TKB48689.1 hypothetical protein FCL40_11075 [Ferrimonas sediminicola]
MTPLDERYRLLRAADEAHFHTCFYCGCIATEYDYAPPRAHWGAFEHHRQAADNLQIPACRECVTLLRGCTMGLLQQRRDVVQTKLAAKYKRAINVYLCWSEEEVEELDRSLKYSIAAGLSLGEESHRRANYPGFTYEIEGCRVAVSQAVVQPVMLFGERFDGIKAALEHAAKTYGISQGKLAQGLVQHNDNLEAVVHALQQQQQKQLEERQMNRLCAEFARAHRQSRRYVVNAVQRYLDRDESLTVAEALERLYQERVRHFL